MTDQPERKVPWLHEIFGAPPLGEPMAILRSLPRWWWAYVLVLAIVVPGALIWGLHLRAEADIAEAARLTAEAPHRELAAAQAEVGKLSAVVLALEAQVAKARTVERDLIERIHAEKVDAARSLQACWQTAAQENRASELARRSALAP